MLRALLLLTSLQSVAFAADWSSFNASGINGLVASSAAAPAGGRPLLVALHGCAQPNSALQQAGLVEAADAAGGVVALPAVPGGGVYAGCWDYYGAAHSDSNRHLGALIGFVEALIADPALQIDPDRVWIAGLSSGAGEALVAGCVAPDLFTGVAAVGGPGLGTEATQIAHVSTNAATVERLCRDLSRASAAFARQQAVFVVGARDYIVAQGYAPVNAEGFAALYGATASRSVDLVDLPGRAAGAARFWAAGGDDRVALLTVEGLDHAWPAGRGAGATMQFVAPGGPALGVWLFEFFGGVEGSTPVEPPPVEPDVPDDCETTPPESVSATLIGHAPRLAVHGGSYGAVDVTYVDLLAQYGTNTAFALHRGPDGWYHDPARIPEGTCAPIPDEAEPQPPAGEPAPRPRPQSEPDPSSPTVVQTRRGCGQSPGGGRGGALVLVMLCAATWRRDRW